MAALVFMQPTMMHGPGAVASESKFGDLSSMHPKVTRPRSMKRPLLVLACSSVSTRCAGGDTAMDASALCAALERNCCRVCWPVDDCDSVGRSNRSNRSNSVVDRHVALSAVATGPAGRGMYSRRPRTRARPCWLRPWMKKGSRRREARSSRRRCGRLSAGRKFCLARGARLPGTYRYTLYELYRQASALAAVGARLVVCVVPNLKTTHTFTQTPEPSTSVCRP